jgi:hypothetical protein
MCEEGRRCEVGRGRKKEGGREGGRKEGGGREEVSPRGTEQITIKEKDTHYD